MTIDAPADAAQPKARGVPFAVGNQLAKAHAGRVNKRQAQYREALRQACTFEDMQMIAETAVTQAKNGDHDARKFLAEYLCGRTDRDEVDDDDMVDAPQPVGILEVRFVEVAPPVAIAPLPGVPSAP